MSTMRKTTATLFVPIAGSLIVAGCAVGPNYKPVQVATPNAFQQAPTTQPATSQPTSQPTLDTTDLTQWWKSLNDPTLNKLIDDAVASNLDVQLALARVRQARAELSYSIGALLPTVDASGSYNRTYSLANGQAEANEKINKVANVGTGTLGRIVRQQNANPSQTQANLYNAGFDANWEIDVFGGNRRAIESSQASLEAQIEDQRNTLVTLLAEVARNYVLLRSYQHELTIVRNNTAAQRDTLDIQRTKLRAGLTNDMTVAQAEALLATTESDIPTLEQNIAQTLHRLAVLLARDPNALNDELSAPAPIPTGPSVVPPGLPSELLQRRPDIRKAERTLAASTANIGVATADLFPRFALTGTAGWQSSEFSNFLHKDALSWTAGPAISWNVFNGLRTLANIEAAKAVTDQSLISYRQAVIQALADVEDALVACRQEQVRRVSLQQAVASNRRAVSLAKQLIDANVADFLNVLTAEQSLYQAEQQLVQSERTVATNLVALYKSLGGGWETLEPTLQNPTK